MITPIQICAARYLMRCGDSMKLAAEKLDVVPNDLDCEMWRCVGKRDRDVVPFEPRKPKRPEPMF